MTVNLDPLYNVVWAYNNKTGSLSSYHTALATPSSDLHRSEVKESILTPELALPLAASTSVSRNQVEIFVSFLATDIVRAALEVAFGTVHVFCLINARVPFRVPKTFFFLAKLYCVFTMFYPNN